MPDGSELGLAGPSSERPSVNQGNARSRQSKGRKGSQSQPGQRRKTEPGCVLVDSGSELVFFLFHFFFFFSPTKEGFRERSGEHHCVQGCSSLPLPPK